MITDEQYTAYVRMYMDTVFRVAFNYLKSRSDADDITQNVLIKLYRANKTFENDAQAPYSGSQRANSSKGLGFILPSPCFADQALL